MNQLQLGEGRVFHARQQAGASPFSHGVFFLHFDLAREADLQVLLRDRFLGMLSFRRQDYLAGKSDESLDTQVRAFLREHFAFEPQKICLQTMPRMFGFVFNPVSFWLCLDEQKLEAVLCEVNNTFGERHFYFLKDGNDLNGKWVSRPKVFHVSPFLPVEGHYQFRFALSEHKTSVEIQYFGANQQLGLVTWIKGDRRPLQSISRFRLLLRYGWMTPLVVARIHYQALKLAVKRVRYYKKPTPRHPNFS